MSDTPKHSVSVAGVVVNDAGQVLVIRRRDNGHWEPPGGVLEIDESFESGVRREVLEETGVEISVDRLTGVYKNLPQGVVALVFNCRPLSDRVRATAEAVAVQWVDPSAVDGLMDPAYAIRIADALGGGAAVTRIHDGVRVLPSHPLEA